MSTPNQLVQKLWNYCNVLRDDGLSYGDYVEQLTYLLFLKMADEQTRPPLNKPSAVPKGRDWPSLLAKDGDELETHYRHTLEDLGKRTGMLGVIFRKAQNKIQDPAKLRRLIVDLIDREQWSSLSADVKGDAYEGLLKRHKVNLDLFWLKDELLKESANLPAPEVIAAEITEDLETALEQFAEIAEDLR